MITIVDGPLGTQLELRGVRNHANTWSAHAIESAPDIVAEIHRDYADAGATVHTANTFRTKRRHLGSAWRDHVRRAVQLVRDSVPSEHRVAGSIAPLEDCYRPDLSSGALSRNEHRELAQELAATGCDILLCETFANISEACVAVEEASATGVETWLALTAGPDGSLLSIDQLSAAARRAVESGAAAVLINCTAADRTLPLLKAVAAENLGVPFGAYANAGLDPNAWQSEDAPAVQRYVGFAKQWLDTGATIVGGCCGTGPQHIRGLLTLTDP